MTFTLHERVRLEVDLPHQGVKAGAVGVIIELNGPDLYEVDFGDQEGSVWSWDLSKVPSDTRPSS